MGAPVAPLGTRMMVLSFTPSRMGTISTRLTKSKVPVFGSKLAGVSPGRDTWPKVACAVKPNVEAVTRAARAVQRRDGELIRPVYRPRPGSGMRGGPGRQVAGLEPVREQ